MPDQESTSTLAAFQNPGAHFPPLTRVLEFLPIITLPVCIVFLQGYAIRFWTGLLGGPGWGLSLGLELLHFWFWSRSAATTGRQRFGWGVLAMLATVLLLASAVHEIARPLIANTVRTQAQLQERQSLETQAAVLRANLTAYREMAAGQQRRGWQDDIRRDTARLNEITQKLRELLGLSGRSGKTGGLILPWLNGALVWVVIAVAVLFEAGVILAVWTLSGRCNDTGKPFRRGVSEAEIKRKSVSAVSGISDDPRNNGKAISDISATPKCPEMKFYRDLWQAIEGHGVTHSKKLANGNGRVTQGALACDLGVKAPDLSAIKLPAMGEAVERKPARAAVETLAEKLGVPLPK